MPDVVPIQPILIGDFVAFALGATLPTALVMPEIAMTTTIAAPKPTRQPLRRMLPPCAESATRF